MHIFTIVRTSTSYNTLVSDPTVEVYGKKLQMDQESKERMMLVISSFPQKEKLIDVILVVPFSFNNHCITKTFNQPSQCSLKDLMRQLEK